MGKYKSSDTMFRYIGRTYTRKQTKQDQRTDVKSIKATGGDGKNTRTGAKTGDNERGSFNV